MLTPAQPESHIHRSIFILPATAPFVNATRVQALGNACVTRGAAIPSAIISPLTLDAESLDEKGCFSLFILPLYSREFGPRPLGGQTHDAVSVLIILCTRIFNPKCYTPPYQTQITPCRLCRHRGSVPTGGHHGITNANGAIALPADRLGSRYRRIPGSVASAEPPREPRRRSNLSRCGSRTYGQRAAGDCGQDQRALTAHHGNRHPGRRIAAGDCRNVAQGRAEGPLLGLPWFAGKLQRGPGFAGCCGTEGAFAGTVCGALGGANE